MIDTAREEFMVDSPNTMMLRVELFQEIFMNNYSSFCEEKYWNKLETPFLVICSPIVYFRPSKKHTSTEEPFSFILRIFSLSSCLQKQKPFYFPAASDRYSYQFYSLEPLEATYSPLSLHSTLPTKMKRCIFGYPHFLGSLRVG